MSRHDDTIPLRQMLDHIEHYQRVEGSPRRKKVLGEFAGLNVVTLRPAISSRLRRNLDATDVVPLLCLVKEETVGAPEFQEFPRSRPTGV